MKISVDKVDTLWGYVSTILSMCINLIMLPFILRYLDNDAVGMYYVFTSLSMLVSFFDFGFSPSFARSISYAWSGASSISKEGESYSTSQGANFILLKKLVVTCRIFYGLIAIIALIISVSAGSVYIYTISSNYGSVNYIPAWLIYAVAIFINLFFDYYSALLRGVGAVKHVNKAMVIGRVIQIAACISFLLLGFGIVGVAIAYFLYGLVFRITAKIYFERYNDINKKIKECAYKVTKEDITSLIESLWPNTWKEGIVTISNYVANQGTTILCSLFFTLYETGIYSLTTQLVQAIVTISSALYNTYQPALQSAYANKDKVRQRKLFSTVIATYVIIYILGMIALLTVGKVVIRWIKPEYELDNILIIVIGIYQFILKYRNCYATYFSSTNRVIYYKAYIVSAIAGIVLSWLVLTTIDGHVLGLVIPQIIVQLSYNAWHWAKKANKEMGLDSIEIIKLGCSEIVKMYIKGEKH